MSSLVEFLEVYDFVAARVVALLRTHEFGALSATTRHLRYGSAISDAFYSTCMVCVPDFPPEISSFIERMDPSAVALVARVRLPQGSVLKRARPFLNAKELHFPDAYDLLSGNQLCAFPRLQHCSLSGVLGIAFVANLPHLRSLELKDVARIRDWTPLETHQRLKKLQLENATRTALEKLKAPPNLQELVLKSLLACENLHCLPVMPQLKTLVMDREQLGSLDELERQQSVVEVQLSSCNVRDLRPLAALRQLCSARIVSPISQHHLEQDLDPLENHPSLKQLVVKKCDVRSLHLLHTPPQLESLWFEDVRVLNIVFVPGREVNRSFLLDHLVEGR